MEFFLFILFTIIVLIIESLASYYVRILFFQPKVLYDREEIVSIHQFVWDNFLTILKKSTNPGLAFLILLSGVFFSYLWAHLGGVIGSPHYTNELGNYFFHFPIWFLGFVFSYPFWKDAYPLVYTQYSLAFSIGLGVGSVAKCFSSYGTYHEMYFLYGFIVLLIVVWVSIYLWNGYSFFGLRLPGYEETSTTEEEGVSLEAPEVNLFEEDANEEEIESKENI